MAKGGRKRKPGPEPAVVLRWLEETGEKASVAVAQFWPGPHTQKEIEALTARIRAWKHLAKQGRPVGGASPAAAPTLAPTAAAAMGPPSGAPGRPDVDQFRWLVGLDRVRALEEQLAQLHADLAWARSLGRVGDVAKLDARASDVRRDLDLARGEAGRVVQVDRDVAAVADAVERRAKLLRALSAAKAAREGRQL